MWWFPVNRSMDLAHTQLNSALLPWAENSEYDRKAIIDVSRIECVGENLDTQGRGKAGQKWVEASRWDCRPSPSGRSHCVVPVSGTFFWHIYAQMWLLSRGWIPSLL